MDVADEAKETKKFPSSPLTADDLLLLVDMFYLPYSHGHKAKHIVSEFKWLKANAIKEDADEFKELTEKEKEAKVTSELCLQDSVHPRRPRGRSGGRRRSVNLD